MSQTIFRLADVVVNQIAAGEVVEHPASVVKELIENSIDARASHISISIWGGGLLQIEIEDDGCGMSAQDAQLSLERHATSKIRDVEDLFRLSTMGFRGEALAAITSIAHFELKTSDGFQGTAIVGKGGVIEQTFPLARNVGTTIIVRSLFYNVPARKKFQKSTSANTAQVRKVVETLCMAHPGVAFSYFSQGEKVFHHPPQEKKERVEAVLGCFAHEIQGPGIWGLFTSPMEAKPHRKGQYVFLNRRPVFSPLISKAVQMGYGTRLQEQMYPPFVLFLEVDPQEIDVNVHPQKKEIRIAQESPLFQKIEKAVQSMFEKEAPHVFRAPLHFVQENTLPWETSPSFPPVSFEQTLLHLEIQEKPLFVMGSYLLLEKEGLKLVSLPRAHARIFFEGLQAKKPSLQMLLSPLQCEGDEELVASLVEMGLEARSIGRNQIAIDALAYGMQEGEFVSFLETWKKDKRIDRAACASFAKTRRKFSLEEAVDLWRELQKCRDTCYDPLGRKIWLTMQQGDLDTWFTQLPMKE